MAGSEKPGVKVTLVGLTDVGRVRDHNEDAFLVLTGPGGKRTNNGERVETAVDPAVIFAVADGMGGAAAGEVASQMASDKMASVLGGADYDGATPDQIAALMDHAIQEANQEIFDEATENAERKGMGTTLTAAVATAERLFISQVGDSRGYLLRKGRLVRLTKDQSLIEQLIEEGTLTEEEAEKLGGRNIVLQAVGVDESLRVDTKHWELLRGDVILLCSDGLTGMIKDEEVERILNECGDDLPLATKQLIDAANAGGGRDNITAVLARFEGDALRAPMGAAEDGVERAGASFSAPPPPDVPNPMKKVGAALGGIILLILLVLVAMRPTDADLTIAWEPGSLDVAITLKDASGAVVREASGSGGSLTVEGLEPAVYELEATAAGHHPVNATIDIGEPGDVKWAITPTPLPGTLTITLATDYAEVLVEGARPWHDGEASKQFTWEVASVPIVINSFPAGPISVTVSRGGHTTKRVTDELLPEGSVNVKVPGLDEKKAALRITAPAGYTLTLTSEQGEQLLKPPLETTGEGVLEVQVRQGEHDFLARKPGLGDFELTVKVVPEGVDVTVVATEQQKARLMVTGEANARFDLFEQKDGEWDPKFRDRRVPESGQLRRPIALKHGHYRLRSNGKELEFDLEPGEQKSLALNSLK